MLSPLAQYVPGSKREEGEQSIYTRSLGQEEPCVLRSAASPKVSPVM